MNKFESNEYAWINTYTHLMIKINNISQVCITLHNAMDR